MLDADTAHIIFEASMALVGGYILNRLQKRDQKIDDLEGGLIDACKETARIELVMAKEYATKESLRLLFTETQNSNRETSVRLEKQIDETKAEVKAVNNKIDDVGKSVTTLGTTILTELSKKT